ncbi:uncharacterized protein LOC103279014 [Anolis carolinensis]|uniref:uncharacterized protein LOC103279014 n=1 Tax=Anolis carolinensis TaxID=28377 RepID=UPI002F2B69C0
MRFGRDSNQKIGVYWSAFIFQVMNSEEIIECIENLWYRVKKMVNKKDSQDLSKEEARIVEEVRQGTLEILQDALKKKDRVLMKAPERVVLRGEERTSFWMKRHSILTEDIVQSLIAELKKVYFKKDHGRSNTAYVLHGPERRRTIYLCDLFWKRSKYLTRRSQPGVLIHEVAHFLGAKDFTYEENTLIVGCKGCLIKNSPAHSSTPSREDDWEGALRKAFLNANNIAHEFELTINHKGSYVNGRYSCCGEVKRYSVCESSVPDYFHMCDASERWETVILLNELHRKSRALAPKLRRINRIVDEIDECLKDVHMGISVAVGGGTGAAVTYFLSVSLPLATGGLSVLWTVLFLVVGLGLIAVAESSLKDLSKEAKQEVYAICNEYQHFRDIQRIITLLNGTNCHRDFQSNVYTQLDKIRRKKN